MSFLRHLRGDLYGGITAGIVALPLALAFGEASGAGPIAGLWGAIITGFFAAAFGGTQTQITGPTGPMVVVFAGLVAEITRVTGAPLAEVSGIIFAAVVLAGVIQILFGIFRIGQYIRLVPYPVISGFMSGIGVIIILLQASRLFGAQPARGGTMGAIEAVPQALASPDVAAAAIAFLSLAIVFFWPKAIGRFVPGALAALIIGTLAALGLDIPKLAQDLPSFTQFSDRLPGFVVPSLNRDVGFLIVEAAIILAVLGAIDSLLTSLVADNATRTRHNSEAELVGQGIGNMVAGFFGAIPGAGATMRTMVNIRTGGVTRLSGMVHGLLLLAVVLALTPLAAAIPHAVLAGILIKVGWDIIDFGYLLRAHKGPRWDLLLMALVLFITVFVDLITAVGVGVFLAALGYVHGVAKGQLAAIGDERLEALSADERRLYDDAKGSIRIFSFAGPLSFGAAADLAHQVRGLTGGREALILDFSAVPDLDVSAAYAVKAVAEDAEGEGRHLFFANLSAAAAAKLAGLGIADGKLGDEGESSGRGSRLTRKEALAAAARAIAAGRAGKAPPKEELAPDGA